MGYDFSSLIGCNYWEYCEDYRFRKSDIYFFGQFFEIKEKNIYYFFEKPSSTYCTDFCILMKKDYTFFNTKILLLNFLIIASWNLILWYQNSKSFKVTLKNSLRLKKSFTVKWKLTKSLKKILRHWNSPLPK